MSTTQETSVTSSQDLCTAVEAVPKKGAKIIGETKAECNGGKSTVEELFPWIIEFKKKCRCLLAQPNIVALIKLIKFYARNVSINVNECYTKPYRAAKLKDSISETLLFFLFYFRELVEVCDKNSYLDKMSDLLAMYLDMELKASRRGKEHHSKIAARLTSCLYVYLENSSEHILDTFIKAKFVNRNYHDILDPVLTKISKTLPPRPNCDTMYVRYLLIYRLWKKVNNDAAVKNQINATAILHLGPPPQSPTPFLAKYVLPKVPKSQANSTKFLLLHKFDIEKSCRLFIQYCKENREDEEQGDLDKPNFVANTIGNDTLETLGGTGVCRGVNHVDNLSDNVNILPEGERRQRTVVKPSYNVGEILPPGKLGAQKSIPKQEPGEISPLKPLRSGKAPPRLKTKKNGDILFIDLTADEITEKVIKKKKQRKLHWLTEVKKKLNTKSLKAAEKKKKAQNIASDLSDDLILPGLVDSTSTGSLSTPATAKPIICSANNSTIKLVSKTNTPQPENCVTSNCADNHEMSEFVEKQPSCDVTTTVIESVPVASTKVEQNSSDTSDSVPDPTSDRAVNHSTDNSCHTTTERDEIPSQKPETWTVAELSTALSHICESYDSDNSNIDTVGNEKADSKQNDDTMHKVGQVDSENMPLESEEATKSIELDKDPEKLQTEGQRCSSESSDVAVIFTRRASDVEIVNLDDYAEDKRETQVERTEDAVCSSTPFSADEDREKSEGTMDLGQNFETPEPNDLSRKTVINNDVKDLTLRTDQLKITSAWETLSKQKHTGVKKSNCNNKDVKKVKERINGTDKRKSSNKGNGLKSFNSEKTNRIKFDSPTKDRQLIGAVDDDKSLSIELKQQEKIELKTRGDNLQKLETSQLVDYDTKKYCDYKSSKEKRLDAVKLTTSVDAVEIAKKQEPSFADEQARGKIDENKASGIRNEYIPEQTSIPKINEILICTKDEENNIRSISNDLLTNQEPEFVENIDGLSLLASVSQHVSHLEECSEKSLSKPKIISGELPRSNSKLKNQLIDEVDADDSYEVLLDLNVSASGEIIDEIVHVPYQLNDNKLTEADLKTENRQRCSPDVENDSLDVVPLILETTVDLNSSTLHNNLISVENVTQMIKESTNVIVNGETVVLFQKSPNSNLYIINKAADGTMECLGDDKKNTNKNIERNSTAMRDIINHIPVNLSEKNTERQEGGKTHRSKTSGSNKNRKPDNSGNKYENSKQFKPICEKFEEKYIKKEIVAVDFSEETFRQRCTDTPGSVIELEPVKKSPPPIIRLTDTPVDLKMQEIYKESSTINAATTGRLSESSPSRSRAKGEGTSIENLTFEPHIKKEFQVCAGNSPVDLNADSLQAGPRQTYTNVIPGNLQFPVNSVHSTKIPHVYSTVTTPANMFNIEHEPCNYLSCSFKMSSSQPYQSIPQSCQLSHCACLKCAYEVHCSQYVQRPAATHSSYIQTNPYFLSNDSPAKSCDVKERELKLNEAALAKLHDDQLLHNIEQSIIDSKKLNEAVKTVPEIKFKPEFENKLPLKKRLKAHAMLSLSYEGAPGIKVEKVENYPGTPMMSIAALETRNVPQATSPLSEVKTTLPSTGLELSPRVKDDSFSHHTTEMIRRDYLKDTSLTSIGNCANVDDRGRKLEHQRRQTNSHVNIMGTGCQRSFKTPAQRKEVAISSPSSLKRAATSVANHPKSPKKGKKAKLTGNNRQTRSSKRNIPKVDYSYDGVIDTDPKYNALSELRRKRKKTSR